MTVVMALLAGACDKTRQSEQANSVTGPVVTVHCREHVGDTTVTVRCESR